MLETPWPVRVRGSVGGAPLDAAAMLTLHAGVLRMALDAGEVALPYEALDGVATDGPVLVLVGRDGAALRCEGLAEARRVAVTLLELASVVPEFTRGLRAFASVRGAPGSDHDLFFAPLLDARRAVQAAPDAESRVRAVSPAGVQRAHLEARAQLAVRRWPATEAAGDRRALEAELDEACAALDDGLGRLGLAAETFEVAASAVRLRAWRGWCAAFQEVWNAADDAWGAVLPALADSRGASGALWRRVLRRGGGDG